MKIAVIGAGVAGLSCAYELAREQRFGITLYEAADYFGGHANTVDITLDGLTHGVDTGFLVFNQRTYPGLVRLFAELDVATVAADMSLSVAVPSARLQWAGSNLNTVFAQRRNLLRPAFLRMLADIVRFNRLTCAMIAAPECTSGISGISGNADIAGTADIAPHESLGAFLTRHRFSPSFIDWYLLPMIGAIWSCPAGQMMAFPVTTLIRFCYNHGLLQVSGRPQWYSVRGGAREYIRKMLPAIRDARAATPVKSVARLQQQGRAMIAVRTATRVEWFDQVVFACHSDQARALLADPSAMENEVLGAIGYAPNRAVLHTDTTVLPCARAWSAWNYESGPTLKVPAGASAGDAPAGPASSTPTCVHYLLNRLQQLPFRTPVMVSLNPVREPQQSTVLREFNYSHPVFDAAAILAQQQLPQLQGQQNTWYCGAWTGYGFHEDGLMSGLRVAGQLRALAAVPAAPTVPPESAALAVQPRAVAATVATAATTATTAAAMAEAL